MAQHDFAPSWLSFPTPPSATKSSPNFEKHSENFLWMKTPYEANLRRHSFSDGFDPNIGRSSGGYFGRKERNGWRSQGRSGIENIHHRGGYYGGCSRTRTSSFYCGKSQGLYENYASDGRTGKKEDKEVTKQFAAEDFPSLNPEYERERKQNKSSATSVWDYPLNPKSRSPRMLVIKKGTTKEMQVSGFPVAGGLHSQTTRIGTGASVYKGLVPKLVTSPTKPKQWKLQAKENKSGIPFPHKSAYGVDNFGPFKSTAKAQNSVKECNWSNSSSAIGKLGQPRLRKLTRMRTDKKNEFLKTLKQVRVEEKHDNENDAGQEKEKKPFNLCNSNSPCGDRDINRNLENEVLQDNGNASVTSQQVIQSSTFPQTGVLSSSLEAELRLLREMGWQEDCENDEAFAPLTEEELKQNGGLRKNSVLKNSSLGDFKFSSWKNSTFKPALENEDSETSSSDTSDDDYI
ncbi:vasculin isoform X2 [Pogoniulus pusillus]|uniref:vasculin isoform X2 n=1 Tax=Pogoniulus pusillus TaxID=488313 RepID=UPI0030B97DBF